VLIAPGEKLSSAKGEGAAIAIDLSIDETSASTEPSMVMTPATT
jgi:hypothetical protein